MSPFFWPGTCWIELHGPDAREYLQRLSTVDLSGLAPGKGAPGLFLNAQGRIQAAFRLWCLEDARFGLELERGDEGELKQRLLNWIEQYHFGEKLLVSEPSGLSCLWALGEEAETASGLPGPWSSAAGGGLRICHAGGSDYGRPLLVLWGPRGDLESWRRARLPEAVEVSITTLERWRIGALSPRGGYELTPESNPLEAGLLGAIAMNKGCYPGQEVIEKTMSLGNPAQRLVMLEGQGEAPSRGTALTNRAHPPAQVGRITSVVATESGFEALAFVRKIHAREGLELGVGEAATPARVAAVSAFPGG